MTDTEPLILDASVVFNLGHRGQLVPLMGKLAEHRKLMITPEVEGEVTLKPRPDFDYRGLIEKLCHRWDLPLSNINAIPVEFRVQLGPGEQSVLALAHEKGWLAAIDEAQGRKAARQMGVNLTGTLGLLESGLAVQCLTDSECMASVWRLKETGFRLPVQPGANDDFVDYMERVRQRLAKG